MALINQDPNYVLVLKNISKHIYSNQVESLLLGRKGILDFWVNSLIKSREELNKSVGPKSLEIFNRDLNFIIDKIMGTEF